MALDFNAFAAGQAASGDPVGDIMRQRMGTLQMQGQALQNQAAQTQLDQQKIALQRQQTFGTDMQGFLANPTATGVASLFGKYPEFSKQISDSWNTLDTAQRRTDATQLGSVATLIAKGDYDNAAQLVQTRVDADKAAGRDSSQDEQALAMLKSGDPKQQKAVLGLATIEAAGAVGPDKAAEWLKSMGLSGEPIVKGMDQELVTPQGTVLAPGQVKLEHVTDPITGRSSPFNPFSGKFGADAAEGAQTTGGGGPASVAAGGAVSPASSSVASALASAGLPAPVVAGFMGNFHAEGGYDGAHGDGGSASGIAQWHNDRLANFERVVGKPVDQATPADQAKFVAWEMQNPQSAGMTVQQRDAILAAKTPAQAAALIDRFYERSSGKDRSVRMAAATAFANDNSNSASPTPGAFSPAVGSDPYSFGGSDPGSRFHLLSQSEAQARGLDPSQQYQLNVATGQVTGLGTRGAPEAPGNTSLSGPAYVMDLKRSNPSLANQVQGVLDTRLAYPPASSRSPSAQMLRAAVMQADPTYDEQAYKRRALTIQQYTPGHQGPGQSMLSAATLINHMYDLAQAARSLPDHTTAAQNAVSGWLANETNQPWLIKYNEGRKFVSSELPKFLEGKAPTEGQVAEHYGSYSPAKGSSGIQTALATDIDYLYGRYQPLIQAYKDNTGRDLNIDTYAPGQATTAKAAALEYYRANGALPTVVTNPSQAAKLPHGSLFVTPDGRVLRRH